MPELPDVDVYKTYLNACGLHQGISDIEITEPRILVETSSAALKRYLKNKQFTATDRYGKHLFVHTDGAMIVHMHFGMTGFLKYFKNKNECPAHTRLLIRFVNDYHLAFSCRRLLGQVGLASGVEDFIAANDLGPDALQISFDAFKEAMQGSQKAIKSLLMDQTKIAGLGNVYVDEILFHARLHPKIAARRLSEEQLNTLYQTMIDVLRYAIDKKADPERFGASYLLPQRHKNGRCPRCKTALSQIKITGRTSYLCRQCQKG